MFFTLAAARFLHYAAVSLLFGLAAFPFYATASPSRPLLRSLQVCVVLAPITGALELVAMAANMGGGWASSLDISVLASAVTDTGFGRIWMVRLAFALLITSLALASRTGRSIALLVTSAALLASVALTGHAAMPGGAAGLLHRLADALHLLAAGWWIGGLLALALVARNLGSEAAKVLGRFSRIGYAAVALLILSGLLNGVLLLGRPAALFTSAYGQVLLFKLVLFAAMGGLALSNRFQLTPALAAGREPDSDGRRLRTQVAVEFTVGLLVLAPVGALGAMEPPISQ